MLALDGSASISSKEWQQAVQFTSSLFQKFSISEEGAHLGIVQFSSTAQTGYEVHLTGNASLLQTTIKGTLY